MLGFDVVFSVPRRYSCRVVDIRTLFGQASSPLSVCVRLPVDRTDGICDQYLECPIGRQVLWNFFVRHWELRRLSWIDHLVREPRNARC